MNKPFRLQRLLDLRASQVDECKCKLAEALKG